MKVCEMCGAQNDDVFTKCSVCGADLPSMNSQDGDDEKTVLIDPDQAPAQPSGLSLKTDTSTYGKWTENCMPFRFHLIHQCFIITRRFTHRMAWRSRRRGMIFLQRLRL